MTKVEFIGKRIRLPWESWKGFEISPEGIHTPRGLIRLDELHLLCWKAAFYERGVKRAERDRAFHAAEDKAMSS